MRCLHWHRRGCSNMQRHAAKRLCHTTMQRHTHWIAANQLFAPDHILFVFAYDVHVLLRVIAMIAETLREATVWCLWTSTVSKMNEIPNPKKPQVKKTLQEVGVSSTESRDAFMNVDELRTESTGNVWEHRNVCISEGTRRARGRRGSAHYPKQTASSVKHGGDARKRKSLQVWLRYSNFPPPPLMLRSFGSPTWTGGFS